MMTTRAFDVRSSTTMITRGVIAFLIACASLVAAPETTADARSGFWKRSERCIMQRINRARRNHGLSALRWDRQMGFVARVHANTMARRRGVWHDYQADDRVTRWYRLGQNTGRSHRCRSIVRSFMRSSGHRANILGSWRFIGAGVTDTGRYIWVQVLFESSRDPGNIWHRPRS